jgi:ABC-type molybdenum transport system ATPase subunit/photorepair protein PhrA
MEEWLEKPFALLAPGEQSFVLLLRASTTKPRLLILDEVFSGMDERMVEMGKSYLRREIGSDQAVVFIGHWESEIPWSVEDGLKVMRLENGQATFPSCSP